MKLRFKCKWSSCVPCWRRNYKKFIESTSVHHLKDGPVLFSLWTFDIAAKVSLWCKSIFLCIFTFCLPSSFCVCVDSSHWPVEGTTKVKQYLFSFKVAYTILTLYRMHYAATSAKLMMWNRSEYVRLKCAQLMRNYIDALKFLFIWPKNKAPEKKHQLVKISSGFSGQHNTTTNLYAICMVHIVCGK